MRLDGKHKAAILALLLLLTATGCASVTEQLERTEKWVTSLNQDTPGGNAASRAPLEPSSDSPSYVHRVTWAGESLSLVAKWYTGNLENWRALAKANPDIKPDLLQIGMKIRIPEAMIVTRDPMTQEFVVSHYAKETKRPKSPPSQAGDLPLIGPKSYSDN